MIPSPIHPDAAAEQVCELCERWKLDPQLGWRLFALARLLPFPIAVLSGWRSIEEQQELINDPTKTAAAVHQSTHTSCPFATGADIRAEDLTAEQKRLIGAAAAMVGLRWGGGARRENGIPIGNEWRHLDLGPRAS